jgi:hypothetical protein
MPALRILLLLALFLAAVACDAGPDAVPDPDPTYGTSSAAAEGAVSTHYEGGTAFFHEVDGQFLLTLLSGPPHDLGPDHQGLLFGAATRPGVGTHGLDDGGTDGGDLVTVTYQEREGGLQTLTMLSEDGELTITSSTASEVRGTFWASGPALDGDLQPIGDVVVRGTFSAPRLN